MGSADFELVRQLKEKHCYVAADVDVERRLGTETTAVERTAVLPDGRTVHLGPERFMAPEIVFSPALAGKEQPGLGELVANALAAAPIDLRKPLAKRILLSGGTTISRGFRRG